VRLVDPRRAVCGKAMELETTKEILEEVFHARPGEVVELGLAHATSSLALARSHLLQMVK